MSADLFPKSYFTADRANFLKRGAVTRVTTVGAVTAGGERNPAGVAGAGGKWGAGRAGRTSVVRR